ncbi:NYN domain-containing protein [Stenotrophomonas sp. SY1]|uniref:NYN domain-containing protein n=1 Tax=Stenotrophomonas sp. SY1 TaxID=477235 RepID=UPI001E3A2E12|nr:NYN domain-containing protein [Stenotrophomonas sp. SY1]
MSEPEKRIALLIDADNAPSSKIDEILVEVAGYGVANVRRAYGDWKNPRLKGWENTLHEFAIRPIQQFAYSKGKNASDMAMVVDAMDLLYARNLDGFAIVSSDADFTPLVMRLLTDGLKVYGFGEQKTPLAFVNACSKFIYLEALGNDRTDAPEANPEPAAVVPTHAQPATTEVTGMAAPPAAAPITPRSSSELRGDARLINLLRGAVEAVADEQGWAMLSAVGNQIANRASFDSRNYGYRKLSDLMKATGLFEVKKIGKLSTVRAMPGKGGAKKTAKKAAAKA